MNVEKRPDELSESTQTMPEDISARREAEVTSESLTWTINLFDFEHHDGRSRKGQLLQEIYS